MKEGQEENDVVYCRRESGLVAGRQEGNNSLVNNTVNALLRPFVSSDRLAEHSLGVNKASSMILGLDGRAYNRIVS